MTISLNHTIIAAKDRDASAAFFTRLFGLQEAEVHGIFAVVHLDADTFVQFATPPIEFPMQHYAFLVDEETFDGVLARLQEDGIDYAADPRFSRKGEINRNYGGRGVYFFDPSGHGLEAITRPYDWTAE